MNDKGNKVSGDGVRDLRSVVRDFHSKPQNISALRNPQGNQNVWPSHTDVVRIGPEIEATVIEGSTWRFYEGYWIRFNPAGGWFDESSVLIIEAMNRDLTSGDIFADGRFVANVQFDDTTFPIFAVDSCCSETPAPVLRLPCEFECYDDTPAILYVEFEYVSGHSCPELTNQLFPICGSGYCTSDGTEVNCTEWATKQCYDPLIGVGSCNPGAGEGQEVTCGSTLGKYHYNWLFNVEETGCTGEFGADGTLSFPLITATGVGSLAIASFNPFLCVANNVSLQFYADDLPLVILNGVYNVTIHE